LSRPTIVYLHGFRSSPASVKAAAVAAAVEALPEPIRPRLHVPALEFAPSRAVAGVDAWVRRNVPDPESSLTFVGSSLGGFYATWLAERLGARAVLVNPAIRPYDDLAAYVGAQTNLYTGATFVVTPAHFDELRAHSVPRITRPSRYFLLVQCGDEVLDWREAVAYYGGAFQHVEGGGDHAFQGFAARIPAILHFARVVDE
jgi:predicted esterase YcpF (UPF0227 family)